MGMAGQLAGGMLPGVVSPLPGRCLGTRTGVRTNRRETLMADENRPPTLRGTEARAMLQACQRDPVAEYLERTAERQGDPLTEYLEQTPVPWRFELTPQERAERERIQAERERAERERRTRAIENAGRAARNRKALIAQMREPGYQAGTPRFPHGSRKGR